MSKYIKLLALLIFLAPTSFAASQFHGDICKLDKDSKECAQAKAWMRRNHHDVLKHERSRTLRQGIRARADGKPLYGSLRACVSCHIQKDKETRQYPKITSAKHHCSGCHKKAAVKLDCFECHSAKPDKTTLKRLNIDQNGTDNIKN